MNPLGASQGDSHKKSDSHLFVLFTQSGFTLIELLIVISLIVILAVMANPRVENMSQTRAYYAARRLRSDIRYVQSLAMQTQARTRIVFNVASDHYQLERETGPGIWASIIHPSTKADYQVTLNTGNMQGVDITQAIFDGNATVLFNLYGEPLNSSGSPVSSPAFAELNAKYQLQLIPETGKVDIVTL